MRQAQGQKANRHGRAAEHVIESILDDRGITSYRQFSLGKSIFDTNLYADFYLPHTIAFPTGLIIESKWQQVGGSAEEKLYYLVGNIQHVYPCPTIIVCDGPGFRAGALGWLRAQAGQGNLYAVFTIAEFLSWCNRTL